MDLQRTPNFDHIDKECLPPPGSDPHKLLLALWGASKLSTWELSKVIEKDPRSALQALRNKSYGYWLIHNIGVKEGIYKIDEAHTSGDSGQDCLARLKRRMQLKSQSRRQAQTETQRLPKAITEEVSAKAALSTQMNLFTKMEAANG